MLICIQHSGGVNCFVVLLSWELYRRRNAQLCEVIAVRTCEDSCTSGKGRNCSWEERKSGEGKGGERGYHFYFQHLFSLMPTWCMPQPRTFYLGKTQVAQGDVQGPSSLR